MQAISKIIRLITLLLCFFSATPALSQANNCDVVAQMTPGNDSIINTYTTVSFQNTSLNATSYRFMVGPFQYPLNTPLTWSFTQGLTVIKLIAYNANCSDTTTLYYFFPGTFPAPQDNSRRVYGSHDRFHIAKGIITTSDGGYLLNAQKDWSSYYNESEQGVLIKSKPGGCVQWARRIGLKTTSNIRLAQEAPGGMLYIVATLSIESQVLVKLDANGNSLWAKRIKSPNGEYHTILNFTPTTDGGLITISVEWFVNRSYLTRLDANGNVVWQRKLSYQDTNPFSFQSLLIKDDKLYVGGGMSYNGNAIYSAFLSKFNLADGQSLWLKKLTPPTSEIWIYDMLDTDSTIAINIGGLTGDVNKTAIGGILHIDTAGTVLYSAYIWEPYVPNTLMSAFVVGSSHLVQSGKSFYILSSGGYILSLQGDGSGSKLIRLDSAYRLKWGKSFGGIGQPKYYYCAPDINEGVRLAGVENSPGLNTDSYSGLLSMRPIDSAAGNPAGECYDGYNSYDVFPISITPMPMQWTVDDQATNTLENISVPLVNYYPEMRFRCPDYIDSCSYLKITGPSSICNLGQSYLYKSHRNKACGQPTDWSPAPGIQVLNQTDSSITVKYPGFGRYAIYARNVLTCVPVEDSIVIIAESKTPPLDLGIDHTLCPNNKDTLHAGPKFLSYLWQDGSTDSLLHVNQPGLYWVETKDSCDNLQRDSILITLAPPVPFSIGPDKEICMNDTLHLTATPGFINYHWSPAYQLSANNTQAVIARPLVDTVYTAIGEKTPGCFAYDTMKVIVHAIPVLNLGPDKSLCLGDNLVLDAGSSFQSFTWNTGASSQQITVSTAGNYFVEAVTIFGCKAFDTLIIPVIYPLPDPQLRQPVLCDGDSVLLSAAGGMSSYLWNTGATGSSITLHDTGSYSVTVKDDHGCTGTDTVVVSTKQPLPANFLVPELQICEYERPVLQANGNYQEYLWSTGATTSTITVSMPATYWLRVMDASGCSGNDTITVKLKDGCITGVFVPRAFSPDNNGINDDFRPLIYGRLEQYEFRVFNRWGTLVFQSRSANRGWDGKIGGQIQDASVFAWTLSYKLEGQPPRFEKGTVTIIR